MIPILPSWQMKANALQGAETRLSQSRAEKRLALQNILKTNADMGIETTPEMLAQITSDIGGPMTWLTGTFPSADIVNSLAQKANEQAAIRQTQQAQAAMAAEFQKDEMATKLLADRMRSGDIPEDPIEAIARIGEDERLSALLGNNMPGYLRKAEDVNRKDAISLFGSAVNLDEVPDWAKRFVSDRVEANRNSLANGIAADTAKVMGSAALRATSSHEVKDIYEAQLKGKGINDPRLLDLVLKNHEVYAGAARRGAEIIQSDAINAEERARSGNLRQQYELTGLKFAYDYPDLRRKTEGEAASQVAAANEAVLASAAKALVDPSQFAGKDGEERYKRALEAMSAKLRSAVGDYDLSRRQGEIVQRLVESKGRDEGLRKLSSDLQREYQAGKLERQGDVASRAKFNAISSIGFAPNSSAQQEMAGIQEGYRSMIKNFEARLDAAPPSEKKRLLEDQKSLISNYFQQVRLAFQNTRGGFTDFNPFQDTPKLEQLLASMEAQGVTHLNRVLSYGAAAAARKPATPASELEIMQRNQQLLNQGMSFLNAGKMPMAKPAAPQPQPQLPPRPQLGAFGTATFSGRGSLIDWKSPAGKPWGSGILR